MIRLITFDLDDTLWAVDPVVERANQALYDWLAANAPLFSARFALADFATLRRRVVERHPEWAHSVTAIRLGVLRLGLNEAGYAPEQVASLSEAAFAAFLEARNQVEFFCHAREVIEELSRNYQLAALSNGNADIERVGLGDYFDFALSADSVGRSKPDPLMFEQALEIAGVAPGEALHVGDHPVHDILGAQRSGFHSLWVNLNGVAWPEGERPSLEVRSLREIPAAVAGFSPGTGESPASN